jgi:peptidoglycan hydrolase-like protein with peptidoglycan-binding domain
VVTNANVNVRGTPAITGAVIIKNSALVTGTIIDGPQSSGGYTWYKVQYANNTVGWTASIGLSAPRTFASTTKYNFGSVTLRNGSRGVAVMELQRFLNAKLNLGLVIDGKLGPKTIAVVKKWQQDHGLVADGLIGVKTKAMMTNEF